MKEIGKKKPTLFESVASRFTRLFRKEEDDKEPSPPAEPQKPDDRDTKEVPGPEVVETTPALEKAADEKPAPETTPALEKPTAEKPTPEKADRPRRRKIIPQKVAAGQKKDKPVPITSLPDEEVGAALRDYVVEHISDERLSVETMAEGLGTSRTGLYSLVHREFDMTPAHFILDLRLKHAVALLERGLKVREVAMMCGFADPKYFGKVMKRRYGILPSSIGRRGEG
jgi:AraC-like DNA-binding protein